MSATPMDLDALRAKVVMSRKQMTQNTPPAPTPADQPSQTSTPTTNTGTVATTTTDPDIIPCLMRTPQDLEPMNPITHLTFSAPTASSSLTTAATRVNSTDTIRSSDNAPATRVQTSHIVLPDKEDGEISDEEVENTSTIAPFIPTGKDPQNDLSQPDVIAQDAMEITLTPLAIPTQPSHPSHQTAREKVVANAQWSAGAARPLPQTPRGIAAKNKHRSLDDNLTPMGQETDFTTLMAEYQKAKSDSKPPLNATNPERASQFDIPGLGQIKNTVHPTTGPKQHERNNRSHPNDRPRSPMPVSRRQRAVRQSTTMTRPRDSHTHGKDHQSQSTPQASYPPQQHQRGPYTDLSTFGDVSANGECIDFASIPSADQISSETQVFALVSELLDHGVHPEYLVQMGIDDVVVNYVSSLRAHLPGITSTGPLIPLLHNNQPFGGTIASTQSSAHFSQTSSGHLLPQSSLQPLRAEYPMHDSLTTTQPPWALFPPSQATLQEQQQLHFMQQTLSQPQNMSEQTLSTVDDAAAMMQLEMIMAYASQVLPPGWDSLLLQREADAAMTPMAVGLPGNEEPSAVPSRNDLPPKTLAPDRDVVKVEEVDDRKALLTRQPEPREELLSRTPARWNSTAEANYTTAKFQDLAISPSQSSTSFEISEQTSNTTRHYAAPSAGGLKQFDATHPRPQEMPSSQRMAANTNSRHVSYTSEPFPQLSSHLAPPTSAPPPPPPPPHSTPPPPPPPPPTPPQVIPPPPPPLERNLSISQTDPAAPLRSETTEAKPLEIAVSTSTIAKNRPGQDRGALDIFYLDSPPNGEASEEAVAQGGSASSQDDMDMDMDMDLDEGFTQPTILKGTWKTIDDRPQVVSRSNDRSIGRTIPSHIRLDTAGDSQTLQVHSAPASMANTPTRIQDSTDQQFNPALLRPQRPGRRATAMDFIPKSQPQVPFIQERSLSYLIDLDDDDDGEFFVYKAPVKAPTSKSRAGPSNNFSDQMSLEDIQQRVKALNNLIKIKEQARLASLSPAASKKSIAITAPQPLTAPTVSLPRDSSNVGHTSNTILRTEEIERRRRSLSDHTKALDHLRSQLQECDQETAVASSALEAVTVSENEEQSLEMLQKTVDEAREQVAFKIRELEDAKLRLQEIEARTVPLISRLSNANKTKERLRIRIKTGQAKSAELETSIASHDQDIFRKRTDLLLLEAASVAKVGATPMETNQRPTVRPAQVPVYDSAPGLIYASALAPASSLALAASRDTADDHGSKRGPYSQDRQSSPPVVKRPRMQAREELTVLTKRMRELAREKALLQLGTTSSPSDGSLSTAKPPNVLPARPSSSDGAVATITLNPQRPKNITSAPPPSHRPPSLLQQAPSKKPTAPLHLKAASTAPAAVDAKHLTTPRNLSRLDDFLAQAKTLPMIPVADHPHANGALLSPWKTSKGIKKLLAAESCIFELDHLCLPSELIRYVIPDRLTEVQIGLSHPQSQPGNKASHSNRDVLEYESPLSMFRSFRFSPRYLESVRDGYRSLTYSNKIDPLQSMCLYELSGGSCNDDSCKSQHLRDCTMTDEELIIDMARYSEGNTPEARQVFAQMQSAKLAHLRASGIHNVDILIDSIAKNHRDFLHDPSRVVKFGERITIGSELLGKSNGMKKRKGVTRYRAVDRIVSNMDANADTSPLDQSPIVMAILAKTLSGSPSKMKRYHEHRSSVDYEKLLEIDTSDETLWIEYAISHLLDTSEDEGELNIHNALSVLARALGVNPTSESLWSLYLDLYTRNGTEVETRQMFEQCLQYVPDAQLLWFRYYLWEKSRNERVYVLDRMLEKACQEPREGDDKAARSRFTLDVVLQIIKTMVSENCVESAKNWLQNFLICSSWEFVVPSTLSYAQLDDVWREQDMVENISATLAAKLLTPIDLCIMWLAFVYLVWFHELPEQLFLDYPNNYIADSRLFTIQWPETEEPEQENELHNIVHEIFLGLTFYFVDCEARPSLIATLKNFVGFLQARGQKQEEILELVNPSQFPESLPEIQDLFCQVRMHFDQNEAAKRDLQQAIQDSPNQPYLWNRYARLLPDEGKAACLEQCALEFFTVEPRHEAGMGRTELALLLYRKLLGLELPYSYTAPPTRLEIAPFKTNVFLWLNYLSLLALVSRHNNSFEHLESAFSLAMDLLSPDKAWVIQAESAIHTIMKDLDNTLVHRAFNGVVGAAVGNFNTSIPNPYDHGTSEETKVLPLWDFSQLNRVVESVWRRTAEGSQELHVYIVDSFLRLYPDNPDLYLWMGEAEEAAGHMNECRKVLVACLKRFPSSDHVWKRMMSIFQGPLGSMDVITKASLLSPLAARLSRMPILHTAENHSKNAGLIMGTEGEKTASDDQVTSIQEHDSDSDMDVDN